MDHEVIPCSPKMCDWLLNSSHDLIGLHPKKNGRVTMELEIPKRLIFMPTLSIVMSNGLCSGRGKRGPLATNDMGPSQRNVILIAFKYF